MKRWHWYLIITIVVVLLAIAGVLYGVLTHTEPGLLQYCCQNGKANYTGTCTDLRWDKKQLPITYTIQLDNETQHYNKTIQRAIELWNNELGVKVFQQSKDPDHAILQIRWGSTESGEHVGGYTQHYCNYETDRIINVDVTLTESTDDHAVYRYIAHELGHVLGLDHDEAPRSIMFPIQPGMTQDMTFVLPSDYDKKLLKGLYRD